MHMSRTSIWYTSEQCIYCLQRHSNWRCAWTKHVALTERTYNWKWVRTLMLIKYLVKNKLIYQQNFNNKKRPTQVKYKAKNRPPFDIFSLIEVPANIELDRLWNVWIRLAAIKLTYIRDFLLKCLYQARELGLGL